LAKKVGSEDEYFGLIIFTLKMEFKLDNLNVLQIDFHYLNTQYSIIFYKWVFFFIKVTINN